MRNQLEVLHERNWNVKILMLAAGGTIAESPDENGLLRPIFNADDLPRFLPDKNFQNVSLEMHNVFDVPKDSSDEGPSDYAEIANAVEKFDEEEYEGIIITHGTDTMHYASAALSFMLENVNKPVVVTGSQLPINQPGTDAIVNLSESMLVATRANLSGVYIVFNHKIIHGCRAKKVRIWSSDAFESINSVPVGKVENIQVTKFYGSSRKRPYGQIKANAKLNDKVAIVKLYPGIKPDLIDYFVNSGYKGLVLEAFGAGNSPLHSGFSRAITRAIKSGTIVVVCSQTLYGTAKVDTYATGIRGAVCGENMLPEVACMKLMYALAHGETHDEIVGYMKSNFRGEL